MYPPQREGGALLPKKRNREEDEEKFIPLELNGLPTLRCPWCASGRLLRPEENDDAIGFFCSNNRSCPHAEVIEQDSTIAFSGMSAAVLRTQFFSALDGHVELCAYKHKLMTECDTRLGRTEYARCIVADRSPLFTQFNIPMEGFAFDEGESVDDPGGTASTLCDTSRRGLSGVHCPAPATQQSNDCPIFYFFVCELCGERSFVC